MSSQSQPPTGGASHGTTAGVFRRVAAGCYDALLLGAIWMLVTLVIVALRDGKPIGPGAVAYQTLLLAMAVLFHVSFWVLGGQTLGMRAWRLKVERDSGEPVDVRTGLVRFAAGLLSIASCGAGLVWLWFDRDELTWHDRLAGTRVIVLPKQAPARAG